MSRGARGAAAVLLGVLVLAACGGGTSSPASSGSGGVPSPTASAATPDRHADPALEALLPTSLGGVTLTRESQRGTDLSRQSDALDAMLKDLGKALADFTLASAYSASGDLKAEVGIWRVQGVDGAKLLDGFAKAVQASSTTPLTVSQPTVGGRQVEQVGAAGQLTQGPLYAFPRADMVLFVQTPDPELADEAIRSLDKG